MKNRFPRFISYYNIVNTIFIDDLKSGLQLLRCFGHLINYVGFSYSNYADDLNLMVVQPFAKVEQPVISYVNEYCTDFVKTLEVMAAQCGFFPKFENQFTKIVELSMPDSYAYDHPNLAEEHFSFIERHPTITKLEIAHRSMLSDAKLTRVIAALPRLTHISICLRLFSSPLSIDDILCIMSTRNSLKTITLSQSESLYGLYGELRTRFADDEWQISIKENGRWHGDLILQLTRIHT